SGDGRTTAALIQFTELFVFDPKQEVATLRVSTSFLDHECWLAAAHALSKQGIAALPELKRALQSPQIAARYAAAVALGEIGPAVDRDDKTIYSDMSALRSKNWGSNLDRTERDRRAKL